MKLLEYNKMVDIEEKFGWLIHMDYDKALAVMNLYRPYFLYPYYMDGKNYMKTHDLDTNRIHVRVENGIIILINGVG